MVRPVQVRPISNDEGNRLLCIVRRGTGSVVTWRRAQMVLLSSGEDRQGCARPQGARRGDLFAGHMSELARRRETVRLEPELDHRVWLGKCPRFLMIFRGW